MHVPPTGVCFRSLSQLHTYYTAVEYHAAIQQICKVCCDCCAYVCRTYVGPSRQLLPVRTQAESSGMGIIIQILTAPYP